ncbi:MAG: hypothetical protein LJE75_01620, partial [Gammaproteobacteria bacterium]|nr:hypothetical protein [Gammaproteobacteria bacterium]
MESSTRKQTTGTDNREQLSFEVLNSLDATVAIEARQVLSGNDALGSGVLKATLVDGRLAVEPLRVDIPGGGVQLGFSLQPRERDVVMTVKADVDFKKGEIDILAKPKANKPESFSLATPVKVHGLFEDFGLGVNPLNLMGSVITFVTSPLHVPVRRVFEKKIPADGKEACEIAWSKTTDE